MIGASFCSGIGAPEVAAPWVDWQFASEIDTFPREVLQHRFGHTDARYSKTGPCLWGDFTALRLRHFRRLNIPLPDIVVAGTPCQSFSIAGLRKGTDDDRGNLTMQFVRTVHAIQSARSDGKLIVLWENVPGVLSDKGNAFGAFLGGMVGAMDALPSPSCGSWPREGMVQGPRSRAAWSVLDAQWFGLAQRRKRVFVVFDFGGAVDPAAVLFDRDSLRGDTPPSRETGKAVAALSANGVGTCGADDNQAQHGHLIASTGDVAHCLNAGAMGRIDYETETMITHTLRGEGFDASEDGTGEGTPLISVFDPNQITSKTNRSVPTPGVRRLTPREAERLQGFPDDWTLIQRDRRRVLKDVADEVTYLRQTYPAMTDYEAIMLAADGPRYKALGNSMAVPVVCWIMDRIKVSAEQMGMALKPINRR